MQAGIRVLLLVLPVGVVTGAYIVWQQHQQILAWQPVSPAYDQPRELQPRQRVDADSHIDLLSQRLQSASIEAEWQHEDDLIRVALPTVSEWQWHHLWHDSTGSTAFLLPLEFCRMEQNRDYSLHVECGFKRPL